MSTIHTHSNSDIYSHVPYRDLSNLGETDGTDLPATSNVPVRIERPATGSWSSPRAYFDNRFMSGIFFSIKNNSYEIMIMYTLIIITLLLMISMTIDSIYGYDATVRALQVAEIRR